MTKTILHVLLAIFLVLFAAAPSPAATVPSRPNIVVILIDDKH